MSDPAQQVAEEVAREMHPSSSERDVAKDIDTISPIIHKHIATLERQLREERERADRLAEALEYLRDYQNGPPLPTWTDGWTKAMGMADDALTAHREARGETR